jgi:hypothetical protein
LDVDLVDDMGLRGGPLFPAPDEDGLDGGHLQCVVLVKVFGNVGSMEGPRERWQRGGYELVVGSKGVCLWRFAGLVYFGPALPGMISPLIARVHQNPRMISCSHESRISNGRPGRARSRADILFDSYVLSLWPLARDYNKLSATTRIQM